MNEGFHYDRVLKDLFQRDHPSLLDVLTGGRRVREFLNVEFPKVEERRADLVALLDDGDIFHLEFQSHNDKNMAYRQGIYCLLIAQKYRRRVRQVVLYVGQPRMRMEDHLDLGDTKVGYHLVDIRGIDAQALLGSARPGDLSLAMLASGGTERLAEIARRAGELEAADRVRAVTQLVVLSGLRGLSGRLRMELKHMGSSLIDINKNVILREIVDNALAEGRVHLLREQLEIKFGPLPKWAEGRLSKASTSQVLRWARKVVLAETLEGVLGKK